MFFIVLQAAQAHINHFPMHNSHPVFILSRSSYQKREKRLQFGSDRNSQSKLKRGIKKKKKKKHPHQSRQKEDVLFKAYSHHPGFGHLPRSGPSL